MFPSPSRRLLVALIFTVSLSACQTRVVTGGHALTADERLRLNVVIRSERGEGLLQRGEKTVNIGIYDPKQEPREYLFTREYRYNAADIEWNIEWIDDAHARVELYEFPPGVLPTSAITANRVNLRHASDAVLIGVLDFTRKMDSAKFEQAR